MNNSSKWFADGTFEICNSTLFVQLWLLVVHTDTGASVPAAFFLLPNKEALTYKMCLKSLNDRGVVGPDVFNMDFEYSEHKAVNDIYPIKCLKY